MSMTISGNVISRKQTQVMGNDLKTFSDNK